MQVQRLVIAEVGEAAAPLGDVSGAVAEDLALHLRGRQAGLHRLLLPLNQHHRIPAGAVGGGLTSMVNAQLAYTLQTWGGGRIHLLHKKVCALKWLQVKEAQ